MSLYLSKIALNPLYAPALKLAADPELLHCKLYALIPKGADQERPILYRVDATDDGPVVLLQTTVAPDWEALELAPRALRRIEGENPATKEFCPEFAIGQRLAFRLLARPSRRKAGDYGLKQNERRKPGPRLSIREDEARLAWLSRKGREHGFAIESVGLTILSLPAIKSDRDPRSKGGSFTAVQFDGVLVVTDPDKLRKAVRNGIGPQKAYGFGLLSLAKVE